MEGPAAPTDPPSDFVTFGHYRVAKVDGGLDELGKGAMGVTYRATDTNLRIPVALKVIGADMVAEESVRRRFQREARAAAQLRHPNIASVLHLGEQGGEFFYAMEFVRGRPLSALLKEQGKLAPTVALALAGQVAAALVAAHAAGLVHRDLKPANLMLLEGDAVDRDAKRTAAAGNRQVKVIDFGMVRSFGVSRANDSFASQSNLAPGLYGTPAYASPEQCSGAADLGGRSDLYSLGVILWQCLAGHLPFAGSASQVIAKHQLQPPPMAQLDGLPRPVIELLAGLLEKDPSERRPPTAEELRDRLDAVRRELVPRADPLLPPPVRAAPPATSPIPPAAATAAELSSLGAAPTLHDSGSRRFSPAPVPTGARSRWPAWLGALLGVPLVAIAALLLLRSKSPDAPAAPAPASTPAPAITSSQASIPAPAATPNPLAAPTAKRNFATALAQLASVEAAEKSGVLGLFTTAQARTGDFAGAKATVTTIANAGDQTKALSAIAAAQARAGDAAGAKATFEEAKATAVKVEGIEPRASYLGLIARAQARAGDIVAAKATAAQIRQDFLRAKALSEIAVEQVTAGDVDGAKATVAKAANPETLALSLVKIAGAQATAGDVAGAKETAAAIRDASFAAEALTEIARAQAKADDIAGAKATLASVKGDSPRGRALLQIAIAQTKVGDKAGAAATASMIASADKDQAMAEIAVAQAKAGDAADAKAVAAKLADASAKARTLRLIAVAQAFAGDLDGAKGTAVMIGRGNEKSQALRGIASAQAWGEGIKQADEWANSFDKPRDRFYACLGVAEAAGAMAQGRIEPESEEPDED